MATALTWYVRQQRLRGQSPFPRSHKQAEGSRHPEPTFQPLCLGAPVSRWSGTYTPARAAVWNCARPIAFPTSFLSILPAGVIHTWSPASIPHVALRPGHKALFARLGKESLHLSNRRSTIDQMWPGTCYWPWHRTGAAETSPELNRGWEKWKGTATV